MVRTQGGGCDSVRECSTCIIYLTSVYNKNNSIFLIDMHGITFPINREKEYNIGKLHKKERYVVQYTKKVKDTKQGSFLNARDKLCSGLGNQFHNSMINST